MGQKILVTGGAGFIGSHLAQALLGRGYHVRLVDDFSTGHLSHINSFVNDVEIVRGSILDDKVLKKACAGAKYVFHQAAIRSVPKSVDNPNLSNEVNVTVTIAGPTGTLDINASYARENDTVKFAYAGSGTGLTAVINASEMMKDRKSVV